jgi:hypothetical protein
LSDRERIPYWSAHSEWKCVRAPRNERALPRVAKHGEPASLGNESNFGQDDALDGPKLELYDSEHVLAESNR